MTNTQWNYLKTRNLVKCDGEVPFCQDWPRKVIAEFTALGIQGSQDLNAFKQFLKDINCSSRYTDDGYTMRFVNGPKLFYGIAPDLFSWYPYVFADENGDCYIIINVKAVGPIRIKAFSKRMDRGMIFKFEK